MIKQLGIILGLLGIGHIIVALTGLRVPASIVGMILLAVLLRRHYIAERDVKDACRLIVSNLGFFFIPPGVALMVHYDVILSDWVAIVTATVISTLLVMVVTALVHSVVSHKRIVKDERTDC